MWNVVCVCNFASVVVLRRGWQLTFGSYFVIDLDRKNASAINNMFEQSAENSCIVPKLVLYVRYLCR